MTITIKIFVQSQPSLSSNHVTINIDNAIHRLNYGTIFKSMGNIHISQEYWLQTFQIPIPGQIPFPEKLSVSAVNLACSSHTNCQFLQSLMNQIHGIQIDTYHQINKTVQFLKSVTPYHKKTPKRKTRTAPGNGI